MLATGFHMFINSRAGPTRGASTFPMELNA